LFSFSYIRANDLHAIINVELGGIGMELAIIGTSGKENEKRVPVHPRHIGILKAEVRKALHFETGYGTPFGVSDGEIEEMTGNPLRDRDTLMEYQNIVITKPVLADFQQMREGAVVFGWIHAVQQAAITQEAIEKRLSLIAWENMYHQGKRDRIHIFNKNNEMAGYCGVQHALRLRGIDGNYGPARKAAVLSLGAVSRGAILALRGHGFHDITVCTRRPTYLIKNKVPGISYLQIMQQEGALTVRTVNREVYPLLEVLTGADIIVNGIMQNPNDPLIFIRETDIPAFTRECLLVDISCDAGMSFSFAQPTSFNEPVFKKGKILYYAVDHTPTLLWDSASWEISNCVIQYLPHLIKGTTNKTLINATDMREGVVLNQDIISYQNRGSEYPYSVLTE